MITGFFESGFKSAFLRILERKRERQERKSERRQYNNHPTEEQITEQLKATDPMALVRRMNNIRERVTEMVNAEVVFV